MCWQDVQITRQKYVNSRGTYLNPAAEAVSFQPDTRRYSVIVTSTLGGVLANWVTVEVTSKNAGSSGTGTVFFSEVREPITLSGDNIGDLINQGFDMYLNSTSNGEGVTYVELFLLEINREGMPQTRTPAG